MYVKGSLKERCMVEAQIIGISIREEGVTYSLDIDGCVAYVPEEFIHFNDYEKEEFHPIPDSLLEDETEEQPITKKRGRPMKATVEDLVNRAKHNYEGPNYNA